MNKVRPRLLMHVCCACCQLSYSGLKEYEVTLFFYNPNIQPKEEFEKRLEAVKKLGLPLIVGDYSPEEWLKAVSGLEKEPENGKRCLICYQFRLEKTAELAKKLGFDYFSTTLNLSPYKDVDFANKTGKVSAGKYGLMYLELNLAKEERFRLSRLAHQKAKESGLYCQKYCGCLFSKK